jgi:GH15 family glucan-1,4-alpha-glucosidase
VRTGNGAATQFQLDVYGEVMDALHAARHFGLPVSLDAWSFQLMLAEYVEQHWEEPDEGIWEVRGGRRHFTYSKVMAWVAFDRAAKGIERHGLPGDATRWRALADRVHADVCAKGVDADLGTFVQSYGSRALDASLLLLPLVGFLPPSDPRIVATLAAIQRDLTVDGLVLRYHTDERISPEAADADGLPGDEGSFLICSFWLVDNLALVGRLGEATDLFERLAGLSNDVGLFSEEYDPVAGRMLGNLPQAFSHVGLINAAHSIARARAGQEHPRSSA